ncbi:cytochrome P450 2 Le.CYP2 [Rhodocollybia butyracea]|uniref:Cytochrome P450 2 Le.CYP2 n=1 Tax=Rhodocollybia butyracea TaxID=206335 RepID=A0A9P5U215_9AGAR|nr:cytochrome P450 2 Le.CYP2 [Rhodocollybia butyracea]
MISLLTLPGISALALASVSLLYFLLRRPQTEPALPYPPGPKSANLPTLNAWIRYQEWGREYGDLIYIRDKNILITNSAQVAVDLLDKRARIYSDRETTVSAQLCEADRILGLQRYGDRWRKNRRFFHQSFNQTACTRFYPTQYAKINDFLHKLTVTPEQSVQHITILSQSFMYASLYGLDIHGGDPLLQKASAAMYTLGQMMYTGFPILERFPWLRFMPSSFPGCGFHRAAKDFIQNVDDLNEIPFEKAMNNLKSGVGTSLIAELALERPADLDMIKIMGAVGFGAASDTTVSAISSFLLVMTLHPKVQAKAQAEIDRVIGRDRLPTFEDRRSLPYIEAIYREVMRLHPPLPLGENHVSSEDDFYRGYHIPKGCVVLPNVWAMNRDPNVYSEPDEFIPERFLNSPDGPFTSINDIHAFGFGRRVCVGRYVADNMVWLAIASVLATLDLRKAKDDDGREIHISGEFTPHFFRHPKPYQSCIRPRDAQALELIQLVATELK